MANNQARAEQYNFMLQMLKENKAIDLDALVVDYRKTEGELAIKGEDSLPTDEKWKKSFVLDMLVEIARTRADKAEEDKESIDKLCGMLINYYPEQTKLSLGNSFFALFIRRQDGGCYRDCDNTALNTVAKYLKNIDGIQPLLNRIYETSRDERFGGKHNTLEKSEIHRHVFDYACVYNQSDEEKKRLIDNYIQACPGSSLNYHLDVAMVYGNSEIMRYLIGKGTAIPTTIPDCIIETNDIEKAKVLSEYGARLPFFHRASDDFLEKIPDLKFDYLKDSSQLIDEIFAWPGKQIRKIENWSNDSKLLMFAAFIFFCVAYGIVFLAMLEINPVVSAIMLGAAIGTIAAAIVPNFTVPIIEISVAMTKASLLLVNAGFYYAFIKAPSLAVRFSIDLLMNLPTHLQQNVLPLMSHAYEGLKQNVVASLHATVGQLVNRATNAINSTERLVNLFASAAITYTNRFFGGVISAAASVVPFMSALLTQELAPPADEKSYFDNVKKNRTLSCSTGIALGGFNENGSADACELVNFSSDPQGGGVEQGELYSQFNSAVGISQQSSSQLYRGGVFSSSANNQENGGVELQNLAAAQSSAVPANGLIKN